MDSAEILWRRLDFPGHDAARLLRHQAGWRLAGTAVFADAGVGCRLDYLVTCDSTWRTVAARVAGWVGSRTIDVAVAVDAARHWRLGDVDCPAVAGCVDIDLAFSPSTNSLPIRRLALAPGREARVRAAWLRFPELTLEPLEQRYHRLDATTYRYESDGGAFTADLRTNAAGFVTRYPGLWHVEPPGPVA